MGITNFEMVVGANSQDLAVNVTAAIGAGWQPYGYPYAEQTNGSTTRVVQAMVKGAAIGTVAPGSVPLVDGGSVTVHNSAGTNVAGTHVAEVSGGNLTDVKLAASIAPVANGLALTGVTPTGTYTDTVTFTVANGVITAIVLS